VPFSVGRYPIPPFGVFVLGGAGVEGAETVGAKVLTKKIENSMTNSEIGRIAQ
jgi:hypothetical protein